MRSLSVLITWHDRPEIGDVLSQNDAEFRRHCAEIIVVNCGGNSERLRHQILESKCGSVRHFNVPKRLFNKALALNLGVSFSHGDLLFVLDADTILNPGFFDAAIPLLGDGSFVTVGTVNESDIGTAASCNRNELGSFVSTFRRTHQIEVFFADGSTICQETFSQDLITATKKSQSQILLNKGHFCDINGFNSEHEGWGWEDIDLQLRMRHSLGLRHLEVGGSIHLSHGDNQRALFGKNRNESSMRNLIASLRRYSRGDFAGTYREDVRQWRGLVTEVTE